MAEALLTRRGSNKIRIVQGSGVTIKDGRKGVFDLEFRPIVVFISVIWDNSDYLAELRGMNTFIAVDKQRAPSDMFYDLEATLSNQQTSGTTNVIMGGDSFYRDYYSNEYSTEFTYLSDDLIIDGGFYLPEHYAPGGDISPIIWVAIG